MNGHDGRARFGVAVLLAIAVAILLRVGLRRGDGEPSAATGAAAPPASLVAALATVDAAPISAGGPDDAGADADWLAVRGAAPITIAGHALVAGRPAPGTRVVLASGAARDAGTEGRPDSPIAETATDAAGAFAFRGVARSRASYRVEAYATHASPAAVSVPGDTDRRDVELLLEACNVHVYGAVRDASGGPVAGARVAIEMLPEHAVVTDASGAFRLCVGPRPGRLRVEAKGYGVWLGRVVPRGALRQDVTLAPAASVAGNVIMAKSGVAVPFARVALREAGDLVASTVADASGAFRIEGLTPGAYRVEARGPSGVTKAPIEVSVFAGSESDVLVPLDARARVRGRVVASGEPVVGAAVSIGYGATFEWSQEARTDAAGAFVIDDAPIGERLGVKVEDADVVAPKSVTVREDEANELVVEVTRKAELAITVSRRGAPVRNATVSLRGPSRPPSRWTGADGVVTFRGLAGGAYRLVAELDGGFAVRDGVAVEAGARAAATLEIADERAVVGRVVDARGAPVDGARVDLTMTSSTEDGAAWAVTGADGAFRGGPLREGAAYRVSVTRSRTRLAVTSAPTVTVSPAGVVAPSPLLLVVEPADLTMSGAVRDDAGGPVADARVVVTTAERHGDVVAVTTTGSDGSFEVRALSRGPFTVKVTAPSGANADRTPVALPGDRVVVTLDAVGALRGTLKGFRRAPQVMAWGAAGYDWDFRPAVVHADAFEVRGLAPGKYYVAAGAPDTAAAVPFEIKSGVTTTVVLTASDKRTVRGVARDFVTGSGLPGISCQAAPYVDGVRSPVVVPGAVSGDASGAFTFEGVPASDLYTWCWGEWHVRGGASRILAAAGEAPITVWMVDPRGLSLDTDALGLGFDDDHPFSRRVTRVESKGLGARAGVQPGDVVETISGRAMNEGGNGLSRTFLAFELARAKRAALVVSRGGQPVPLTMTVD